MVKYSRQGKIVKAFPLDVFVSKTLLVNDREKRAFSVLLYYSAVRVSELLHATKEQFTFTDLSLTWSLGARLKGGNETAPLVFSLELPFMAETAMWIKKRRKNPIFTFNRVTAWRILRDYYDAYPHYFRLNRITEFLRKGFTLPEVMSWTGHRSISSINAYVGTVSVERMAESLLSKDKA